MRKSIVVAALLGEISGVLELFEDEYKTGADLA